ncbi:hypothetical protein [Methylobacterium nodulans]|uniref:hypothetical protein n=1 Tax=Methylobacterium nodulans TaxID=114616 RepID=UPI0009FE16DB|nr:hypothetical protein [Methylobacterium nodulans]
MNIKTIVACLGFSLLALSSPALSQGTPEQQQACTPDAMNLCSEYIPDAGRVKTCLMSKRRNLSSACRAAIASDDPKPRKRQRRPS